MASGLGRIEERKFSGWSSEEDEQIEFPRPMTPPMEDFEVQFGSSFDPFKTPPSSPQKKPDPFKTPSPHKDAMKVMKELKVTPSKVSPGSAATLVDGLRSTTRKGLDPKKRDAMQSAFDQGIAELLLKGEERDSPKGHQQSVEYARRLDWVDIILTELHHSKVSSVLLFDVEHIVVGQREEVDKVGKLSGKHFFTEQQFGTLVTNCIASSQRIRVVTWKMQEIDVLKRSTIFPDGFSPENLISNFQGTEPLYWRGNRSLRIIKTLCVELYHRNYVLRSAFPPFYWDRLEMDKSYTIADGRTYTTHEILAMVQVLNAEYAYPKNGPNPIEFYNKKTGMCVVDVASKVGLVDKGIYFEVPAAMLVPSCLSQDDFEELTGEIA